MKIPRLIRTFPATTEAEIRSLESELGVGLPKDYRDFLLITNGGVPDPELAIQVNQVEAIVLSFRPVSELRAEIRDIGVLYSEGHLPIAWTNHDSPICLCFLPENFGAIEFLDAQKLIRVARSFSDFIDFSCEIPSTIDPIERLAATGDESSLNQKLGSGITPETTSASGFTIIEEAAKCGNEVLVKACIVAGHETRDALHLAVRNGHKRIAKMLIDAGVDPRSTDSDGLTTLEVAGTRTDMTEMLRSHGAR